MVSREHRSFINKMIPILKKDDRIAGVALGGSYITGEIDEYSTLDFVIAIYPQYIEQVMKERVSVAEKFGKLLASFTAEHINNPSLLICMYDEPLLHVDLNFIPLENLVNRYEDPAVLYERDSAVSGMMAKKPAQYPQKDLQWFEDRFWVWVHFIANRIARNEPFDAIESISTLRLNVIGPLLQMKNGRLPRGVRHVERDAPEEMPALLNTIAVHDTKSCIRALKAVTDLYIYLRAANYKELNIRVDAEKRALQYLDSISEKFDN